MARKKPIKRAVPIKIIKRNKLPRIKSPGYSRSLNKFSIKSIPLVKFLYAAFILGFLNIATTLLLQNTLPPEVPLYYGLAKSQEQLTTSFGLITPGVITLGVAMLNTFLAYILGNGFLQKTLVLSAFSVSIISFIATIEIIFLVGSF